ncbi:MAG TPA: hypothetical protein V6D25_09405 [Leptolyngbyaceae cyanobacterium]
MLKYPDLFDVRKLAITLAVGPMAFLLLVIMADLSARMFVTQQTANACLQANQTKLQASACR